MAKSKKPMKGVFQKSGYWYARVDGREVYCGKGIKGQKTAETRRKKYEVESHENREIRAGLKIKKIEFKTIADMVDWFMALPSVKETKSYVRRKQQVSHIKLFFGNMGVSNIDVDLQEDYAEVRLQFADDVAYDMTSSMHHDLERGNRLEVRWLSGGVVELGQQKDVHTPLNRAIADILALHAAGNAAPVYGCRRKSDHHSRKLCRQP